MPLEIPPFDQQVVQYANLVTWTNMPAALTEFAGLASTRVRGGDWTRFTQIRISCLVFTAGTAGAVLYMQYSTDNSSWNTLTTNQLSIATGSSAIPMTAWEAIPTGAQIDAPYLRWVGSGGDAAADPILGQLTFYLK